MQNYDEQLLRERKKIDKLNHKIAKLLDARFKIAKKIAGLKEKIGMPIFQPKREKQVLARIKAISSAPRHTIPVFKAIIRQSRICQREKK